MLLLLLNMVPCLNAEVARTVLVVRLLLANDEPRLRTRNGRDGIVAAAGVGPSRLKNCND